MTGTVKICPQCGEEFVPTAELCNDCRVPLVHEGAEVTEPEEVAVDFLADADPADLVALREDADAGWARRLADALQREGVRCRVAPVPASSEAARAAWTGRFLVVVRKEDAQAGREIDTRLLRQEIPDLEEGHLPTGVGEEISECPACGSPVTIDTVECAECGLVFSERS